MFIIDGQTIFAFGGANSHDRFGAKVASMAWEGAYEYIPPRVEGKDWWPQEIPSQADFENACINLDKVGWHVDHVISHTCPLSQRPLFLQSKWIPDPTESMLQQL